LKGDATMRQESQRLKEELPKEITLKPETFTFTMETIYFSNATSND
jgi:hypothetical protein